MKKIFFAFSVILILSFATSDWITVQLNERVSINFPDQPIVKDLSGTPYWASDNDGKGKCVAMITDYGKLGIDSATLSQSMTREAALTEIKEGLLRDFKNSVAINERRFMIKNYLAFEILINTGQKESEGQYDRMYYRAIIVSDKLYSLYFYQSANNPNAEKCNRFFESFMVK